MTNICFIIMQISGSSHSNIPRVLICLKSSPISFLGHPSCHLLNDKSDVSRWGKELSCLWLSYSTEGDRDTLRTVSPFLSHSFIGLALFKIQNLGLDYLMAIACHYWLQLAISFHLQCCSVQAYPIKSKQIIALRCSYFTRSLLHLTASVTMPRR